MPVALHSYILEPETLRVLVRHTFYGETEEEADRYKEHHLKSCEYFRAAENEGRTIEVVEEIARLPDADVLEELEEEGGEEPEEDEEEEEPEEEEEEVES